MRVKRFSPFKLDDGSTGVFDNITGTVRPLRDDEDVVTEIRKRRRCDNEVYKNQRRANNATFDIEQHINVILNENQKKMFMDV